MIARNWQNSCGYEADTVSAAHWAGAAALSTVLELKRQDFRHYRAD
jgi:hypothetical protein